MLKALLIAAGRGERLGEITKDRPKPLVDLLGLSLIERIILTAREVGIRDFVIVIGYKGEKIKEKLGNGEKYGVKIEYVENREWKKGNALSVVKAKDLFNDKFVLLMSDHIFNRDILSALIKSNMKASVILAVDRREPLEEDTKVLEEGGLIRDIGKKISKANAIDTGIFMCSPRFFQYVERAIKEGKDTLSSCVLEAAKNGDARVFDISKLDNAWWIDIDTKEDLREAERILCRNLIKRTDGPISKYINRPISIRISRVLAKTSIKPSTISIISFILCVVSFYLFFIGNYLNIALAGVVGQISSIIDGCDGEIARLKFMATDYGAWLDAVLDRYGDAFVIAGIIYASWISSEDIKVWLFGLVALIGTFMNSYTAIRYDSIFAERRRKHEIRIGRDVRMFLIMIGSLLNQLFYTLVALGILTNAEVIRRIYVCRD